MLILGIETATPVCAVAIGGDDGVLAGAQVGRGRHAEFLMPAVAFLCEQAGVERGDLEGVAVDTGPGLFTGMRVGVAAAKALAQALSVPVLGVPSLDLLAYAVHVSPRTICACIDARRGEVFAAFYRGVPGGAQRLTDYAAYAPEALAAEIEARGEDVLLVGSGAVAYRDRLHSEVTDFAPTSAAQPDVRALVELASPRIARGERDRLEALAPLYVRRSDAEINWERRGVAIERPSRVKIPGENAREAGPARGEGIVG